MMMKTLFALFCTVLMATSVLGQGMSFVSRIFYTHILQILDRNKTILFSMAVLIGLVVYCKST